MLLNVAEHVYFVRLRISERRECLGGGGGIKWEMVSATDSTGAAAVRWQMLKVCGLNQATLQNTRQRYEIFLQLQVLKTEWMCYK